ncbi:MAG: recombinase family protein [Faecalimonas sp.]|nr:recombinase family protein [Faecalimonas sp.]
MNTEKEKQVLKIPASSKPVSGDAEESRPCLRVAAYCRVSTELESQAGSYARQISYYQEKIEKRDEWILAGVYADEGTSGTVKKKRDGFLRLLQDCEAGKIDLILTKSISRFARNTVDLLTTIRNLKSKNIAVYFEKENINTLENTGEILITILSSQAQEESRNISENIRWSLRSKYEKGELTINYNHFMGYTKGPDGKLEPVPEEAVVVQEIFHLYLIGYSGVQIKKYLEQHQRRTVMDKTVWQPTVIDKMVSNEKYIGAALMQKTYTVDFLTKQRVKNNGMLPKYFVEDNHPAIISKEIFYGVQEQRLWRSYVKRQLKGKVTQYALTGKLLCYDCGSTYMRATRRFAGNRDIIWRCGSYIKNTGRVCRTGNTISEKALHLEIWNAYAVMRQALPAPDHPDTKEQRNIAQQMLNHKKAIEKALHENVQGFWTKEALIEYYISQMNSYYELAEKLCQLLLENDTDMWIASRFRPIKGYSKYKKYGDELVSLYVDRIWVIKVNEIVVLFKNGSMVRRRWYY